MILSKPAILEEHKKGNILYYSPIGHTIEGFTKNQSVDIHIGNWIYFPIVDQWVDLSIEIQGLIIPAQTFFLAYTEEFIGTSSNSNIHPQFHQRSTLARLGLSHTKAGWGDVGFCNRWCMEFYALIPFKLQANMRVGQISFSNASQSYQGYAEETGNYQSSSDLEVVIKNWSREDIKPKSGNC